MRLFELPDLNPIKLLWHKLKHFLCTKVKPKTKEELLDGIARFWSERVDAEKCSTYIRHLQKVLPVVVERQGKASGHKFGCSNKKTAHLEATKAIKVMTNGNVYVFCECTCIEGRRGGLMVSALDSRASAPGSSPGLGHYIVFLGKTLYPHGASLHPGV